MMTQSPNDKSGSPERFGFSWSVFSELLPIHEEQFRGWTQSLPADVWTGASFLDGGCGMGRNSFWAVKWGASKGRAIDIDARSLDAARRNLTELPVSVEYQSLYSLDDENQYDIAFSIGVIHHLEDPLLAVNNMVRAAKPGGLVMVWLYGYENNEWIVRWFNPFRHAVFSKLPSRIVYFLSYIPSFALWLLLKAGWGKLRYHDLMRSLSFRHLRAIVFDQMIPQIARYYRKNEVEELMASAGLEEITLTWVNEISWSASGRKPNLGS